MTALYKPSAWGAKFHALPHNHALGAGSVGPGKTEVLIMEPLAQILVEHERVTDPKHKHPLARGQSTGWALHLRRTFPMIVQTVARAERVFPLMDPGARYESVNHTWRFSSGYRYQFGHCKDPDDWQQYFSSRYTIILFDELVQFQEEQYDQIAGRIGSTDPVLSKMLKVRSMSNPVLTRDQMDNVSVDDPLWVRRRFVDPAPEGSTTLFQKVIMDDGTEEEVTRIYLPATLADNPNPIFRRQIEMELKTRPPHIQQALLRGNWYAQAGSFYGDDWDAKIHTCKAFKIPPQWLRFRSMDWGYKSPGVILWWAMDEDGNCFVERELVFKGMTAAQVAKEVQNYEKAEKLWYGSESRITGPADTQIWEARGSSAISIADEFRINGVPWVRADKTSRKRNASLLIGRLRDHQKKASPPGIIFFENCKQTIKTLPSILAIVGDPETPQDGGWDHAHDAVLYGCAFASRGRQGIPQPKSDKVIDYTEKESNYGADGYGGEL